MTRGQWIQCRLGSRYGCLRWGCWLWEVRRYPLYMRSLRAYLPHTVVPEEPFGPASCIRIFLGPNRARQLSLKCYSPYLGKKQQVRPGVSVFETVIYRPIRSICDTVAYFYRKSTVTFCRANLGRWSGTFTNRSLKDFDKKSFAEILNLPTNNSHVGSGSVGNNIRAYLCNFLYKITTVDCYL
jgi:hypothetical protein